VCGNTYGVPLYACEECGFTSAAFRPEAARAHRVENPDCEGVIRIIFRSEDRYRDPTYAPPEAIPPPAPLVTEERPAPRNRPERTFAVHEKLDPDEAVRLTLVGDLDLAAAEVLTPRLAELKLAGRPTRLDLSQLAFIDSAGIQVLLVALTDARWDGWPLEIAPELSATVRRAAEIVGIGQVLWPQDPDQARAPRAEASPTGDA
jgi:anti-sigma B factor antagonist